MRVNLISRDNILQYVNERIEEVSAATVVKEMNVLKHLMGLMCDEWRMIPANPSLRLKPPKRVPAGRVRYLQPTELRAVITACPDWLRGIVGLAAFTGMRRSEVLGLKWMNVDLAHNRLMLTATKNNEGRIVYLNRLATDVIKSQWAKGVKPASLVFLHDYSADNVSKGFNVVCRKLGIEDFHFHDLRHTAASWMRMRGADVQTVASLLGHKDMRMAIRYQHLSADHLEEAVGRLDEIFGEPKALPVGTK